MWRLSPIVLLVGCLSTAACESAQTRSELARQAKVLDALEGAVRDARHHREERDLIAQRLERLAESVMELTNKLTMLKADLRCLAAERDEDVEQRTAVARQVALLAQRVEVLEAGQRDIVAGLQSLARNREELTRLDARLSELEDKIKSTLERPESK